MCPVESQTWALSPSETGLSQRLKSSDNPQQRIHICRDLGVGSGWGRNDTLSAASNFLRRELLE